MVNTWSEVNRTRELPNPFDEAPVYEQGIGDIMYIAGKDLRTGDVVQVYKTYNDINGDILEIGDIIKVSTTILPQISTQYTYLENAR